MNFNNFNEVFYLKNMKSRLKGVQEKTSVIVKYALKSNNSFKNTQLFNRNSQFIYFEAFK